MYKLITFSDNPESSFSSNEEFRDIESCSRLARPSTCLDDFTRGENDSLGEYSTIAPTRKFRRTYRVQEPFASSRSVSNSIGYEQDTVRQMVIGMNRGDILPEQPVLIIPPMVAPGPGSI